MNIVRSLVTKLSFKVDNSGLNTIQKAINEFKNRVVITSDSISSFASKALSYFGEISKASRDTAELARNTKLATRDFVALRRAAESFQLAPEQFDATFSRLATLLREAKSGYGELFEIQRRSRGELNFAPFIQSGDVKGTFEEILKYIGSIKDIGDQLRAASDIFGEEQANGILRIVEAGPEAFRNAAKANEEYAKSFEAGIPAQKEYLKNLTRLSQSFEKFERNAVNIFVPAVSAALEFANRAVEKAEEEGAKLQETVKTMPKVSFTEALLSPITEAIKYFSGQSPEDKAAELRGISDLQMAAVASAPVTITNNIDISVPPGTNQEQAENIGFVIQQTLDNFLNEKIREVVSNNPQAE